MPTEKFLSQLLVLREIFKAVHGKGLRAGVNSVQTLTSDMEKSGVDLPPDVISFFCKNINIL